MDTHPIAIQGAHQTAAICQDLLVQPLQRTHCDSRHGENNNSGDPGPVPGTGRVYTHMGTEDLHTGARQTAHLTVTVFCLDYTHF